MNLRSEPEISIIRQHIDELKAEPWLDRADNGGPTVYSTAPTY